MEKEHVVFMGICAFIFTAAFTTVVNIGDKSPVIAEDGYRLVLKCTNMKPKDIESYETNGSRLTAVLPNGTTIDAPSGRCIAYTKRIRKVDYNRISRPSDTKHVSVSLDDSKWKSID